jgi:hypothetical protein
MYALDDLCLWKKLANDEVVSPKTVSALIDSNTDRLLLDCVLCSGYKVECKNYVMLLDSY